MSVSIVIPARNEATALSALLERLEKLGIADEIIVIDDGSDDDTARVAQMAGVHVLKHPYPMGNGAAIKTGARAARGDVLVFLDADGQHDPDDIPILLEKLEQGYDMVVGARAPDTHAGWARRVMNETYNLLARYITGHRIADLTSGLRAVRTERFREFLYLLPNGFSYPTTITMAFFRSGYPVAYVPIRARARIGTSHIRPLHDGIRFFLIIFRIGTLYSPLKIFAPLSLLLFLLGIGYYLYTYLHWGRFTNMSALLVSASIIVFLIGLVSEQITALIYKRNE